MTDKDNPIWATIFGKKYPLPYWGSLHSLKSLSSQIKRSYFNKKNWLPEDHKFVCKNYFHRYKSVCEGYPGKTGKRKQDLLYIK